jgi:hypothetical protein
MREQGLHVSPTGKTYLFKTSPRGTAGKAVKASALSIDGVDVFFLLRSRSLMALLVSLLSVLLVLSLLLLQL